MIEALEPLAQDRPFDLHFFGTVSEQTDYGAEFFRKVKQHTWCHYGGMLSRDALRAQFSDADILVLPALEDNCPMVILEAMTAGVAVVASRVGGIPDLIDDERTGLLIQPENPESIRNAVWRILEDDTLAERLRASALTEAERRFQPRAVAERHQEIYREVITGDL